MSEVKVSLNGKNFKDYEVRVSEYNNLVGLLERKDISTYDWGEYHGVSVNLRKPKFKERELELKCFIRGSNWETLFANFKEFVIGEFSKSGTQRLHIKPFEAKTLAYEVYIKNEVIPEKVFRDGEMFGVFTLKMIEPNPIKKVLKTNLDTFKLSYKTNSETEIFFGDGTKQIGRGDVSLIKDYSSPSYQGSGFTLIQQSGVNNSYYEVYTTPSGLNQYLISVEVKIENPKDLRLYVVGRKENGTYSLVSASPIIKGVSGNNLIEYFDDFNISIYGKLIFKVLDNQGNEIPNITYSNPRIETAEILGEWQNMLGKEKIIIIAGNIEEIHDFSSQADILWEKI